MEIYVEFNLKVYIVIFFLAPIKVTFELVVSSDGAYYMRILMKSIYVFGYFPLLW